jgi:hypothetical protein
MTHLHLIIGYGIIAFYVALVIAAAVRGHRGKRT